RPACWLVVGTTFTSFSESAAACSAAITTLALLGSTITSSAETSWIAASMSYVDGFSVGPPSSVCTPSSANSSARPPPLTTATAPQRVVGGSGAAPAEARPLALGPDIPAAVPAVAEPLPACSDVGPTAAPCGPLSATPTP